MMLINSRHEQHKPNKQKQQGAALIITLVVMLVLTMIGVASTDSNQMQAMMVRNSQFRLEAFNSSYSEIDAQIDGVNTVNAISTGIPGSIDILIRNKGSLTKKIIKNTDVNTELPLITSQTHMEQEISSEYVGTCVKVGFQVDVSNKLIECHRIKYESDAQYKNTNIQSEQVQNFEYETFKAS